MTSRTSSTFLQGGGEMGALIRAHDWSVTPLGPPETWPQALKTSVRLMLTTNHPVFIFWGPELIQLYNDAYRETMGPERHPSALGQRGRECWDEIWDIIGPQIQMVMAGEGSTWHVDALVPVTRHGRREDVWWTYGYNPIDEGDGRVGGVLVLCQDVTKEHNLTHRLREETDFLRDMFSQAPGFMCLLRGPEHIFDLANDAYRQLVGGRDVLGKAVRDALPEIAGQGFYELLDRVYASGEAFVGREISVELTQSAGHVAERFLDFVYQPIKTATGEVRGIFVQGTDVTDRRRAEEAARAGDVGRQVAMGAARLGSWDHRPDRDERNFDARARDIMGFPRVGAIGLEQSFTAIHPDDRERMKHAMSVALDPDRAGPFAEEFRLARPDKDGERWVSVHGRSYFENGICVRFAGVMADISDRKRAEAALMETEQALRDLNATLEERVSQRTKERDRVWALSRDLIAECGLDGYLHSVNPAWTRLLGYSQEALRRRRYAGLIHPDDLDQTTVLLERLRTGETIERVEFRIRSRDGAYRWLSWMFAPEGDVFYAVGRDVTAEREAAETLKLTEEALRQSQKMEALGQLTGGIAHDFNNLLTGITGSLDLIRRRIAAGRVGELERLMEAAIGSANRAAALTHRLLAFARRQSLDTQRIDANQLIDSMEELLTRTLGEQVALTTEKADNLWLAMSDTNQLESALLNLSINARDAMPNGGRLKIATANVTLPPGRAGEDGARPGDYVAISVADTGQGMSEDVRAKAFDPFFTTKPIGQGTGLGLSMVYGFANQSGGHVTLESAPGKGTTITLYLPRGEPAEGDAPIEAATSGGLGPVGAGETVLVVEDEPAVRMLVIEVLTELGYRAIEAGDAATAIPILESGQRLDLMISDVGLPGGLNGRQLAEVARGKRPTMPILFVTGYAEKAAARRGFLGEGMEMIAKPFAMEDLANKIRTIIAGVDA